MSKTLRESVSVLINSFPQANDNSADMKSLIDVYEYALQGVNFVNVQTSVNAFIQGRVEGRNNAFRPSPAELAQHARRFQMVDDRIAEIRERVADRIPERQALRLESQRKRIESDE